MKLSWPKLSNQFWIFAFWFYFGILMTICISAYLKMLPVKSSTIPFYDTVGHFILIGLAAFLGHLAMKKRKIMVGAIFFPLAPLLVSLFTLIEEVLQNLSPNRTFSLSDLAADLVGIVFFYWLAEKVRLSNRSWE